MHNWQTIYYIVGVTSIVGGAAFTAIRFISSRVGKAIVFFTRMDTKLDRVVGDVDTILTNHLPHIYERLGEKSAYDLGQDSTGDPGGDRSNQG